MLMGCVGADGGELLLYVADDGGRGVAGARVGGVQGDREGGEDGERVCELVVCARVACAAQG